MECSRARWRRREGRGGDDERAVEAEPPPKENAKENAKNVRRAAAGVRLDKVVRARKRAEVNYREKEQAARGLAVAARRVLPQRSGAPQRAHCVARRRR